MTPTKRKAAQAEKPLFIPLKREFFTAFALGEKVAELRRYGPRWNEKTCRVGRKVTLSLGYGKKTRLECEIFKFEKVDARSLYDYQQSAVEQLFGSLDVSIAKISVCGLRRLQP